MKNRLECDQALLKQLSPQKEGREFHVQHPRHGKAPPFELREDPKVAFEAPIPNLPETRSAADSC